MPVFRNTLIAFATVTVTQLSLATPAPQTVRAEIESLLAKLQSSSCTFNRNGKWHSAAEAQSHLRKKLKYLEDRDAVQTTERFIELAASGSSSSGKPYLVKCGGGAPLESKAWLSTELKSIRGGREPEKK